jgi:oligoendopeptidase F
MNSSRNFLKDLDTIQNWDQLHAFFTELTERKISSKVDLLKWLSDRSELEAVLSEEGGWRYVRMTVNTKNEKAVEEYNYFVNEIEPKAAPFFNQLNKKFIDSEFSNELTDKEFFIYKRGIEQELDLFREENIPLQAEIATLSQKYGAITGVQSITYKNEVMTMPKAAALLKSTDRNLREDVYKLMSDRREKDTPELDQLFNSLTSLRNKVATNAGFKNYRDYMFAALGRFDYTVKDCENFHQSIKEIIVPYTTEFTKTRKAKLGYDVLKPWDTEVDPDGKSPLKPFTNGKELIEKSIVIFDKINSYFGNCLRTMNELGRLDLESKDGKAPGGYNYPLYETGVPYIFMNAVGTQRDLVTMVHEGGHAIHSFLTHPLKLTAFKSFPSEVAELASMSMELISMDYWNEFYTDAEELKRAKKDQLEKIISILPWIATVDKFQHWIYENPNHTNEERTESWMKIMKEFSSNLVDYSGLEYIQKSAWQKQLHIYEVPFYYIEYGMAQLGAIAIWRNYKKDPEKAVQQYMNALSLGYTRSIPEIYEAAGIKFDFSANYVKELLEFIKEETGRI